MRTAEGIFTLHDIFRRPLHIRSTEGVLVVTREHDAEDYILTEGGGITLRPKGLLAIRGLTETAGAKITGGRWGERGMEIRL